MSLTEPASAIMYIASEKEEEEEKERGRKEDTNHE